MLSINLTNLSFQHIYRMAFLSFLGLFLTACDSIVDVVIDVDANGSGEVRIDAYLDEETEDRLFDLDSGFKYSIEDLQKSGWEVTSSDVDSTDRKLSVKKYFSNPKEFEDVFSEVTYSDPGFFKDFVLEQEKSFGQSDYHLTGVIDSSSGLEAFTDPAFEKSLGSSLDEFSSANDVNPEDIQLNLLISLPGDMKLNSGGTKAEETDGYLRIPISLKNPSPVDLDVTSSSQSLSALLLRGLAIIVGITAFLFFLSRVIYYVARLRDKDKKKTAKPEAVKKEQIKKEETKKEELIKDDSSDKTDEKPSDNSEGSAVENQDETNKDGKSEDIKEREADNKNDKGYSVVVLDGMGVLYKDKENVRDILIPFLREKGVSLPDSEIINFSVSMTLGRISPEQFWSDVGAEGDPSKLTDEYLTRYQLSKGVVKYLLLLHDDGKKIGCLTNDSTEWAEILKVKHSLGALVDFWVVSGSVGARKPSFAAFEAVRKISGESKENILLIDDQQSVLDEAKDYGFKTKLYFAESDDVKDVDKDQDYMVGFPLSLNNSDNSESS